ncbi:FAD:protein FMN transferase [Primorskyibacter sp. 2E107]|uniref:FAD:protein FMN transferase n=1 Tax=Primorskyibacter sp. 2E107 TaxID=3403458 RepID=UPI003AF61323
MKRRRFIAVAAAFACAPRFVEAQSWQGQALGANVSLTLNGPRSEISAALAELSGWLETFEDTFSLYRSASMLSRLNRDGRLSAPGGLFEDLVQRVSAAHDVTDGLFDPTVQPLWDALAKGENPGAARSLIGWDRVQSNVLGQIRMAPGQKLTFNGVAQGYATDLVRDALHQRGFTKALINIGEYAALGGPFRLGLSDPAFGMAGQVTLSGHAIATSSPGALLLGGHGHILGPQGQRPLWSTLSIEADSAALADALSTAGVFMRLDRLRQLKRQAGLRRIIAIDQQGNLRSI